MTVLLSAVMSLIHILTLIRIERERERERERETNSCHFKRKITYTSVKCLVIFLALKETL